MAARVGASFKLRHRDPRNGSRLAGANGKVFRDTAGAGAKSQNSSTTVTAPNGSGDWEQPGSIRATP